MSQDERIRLYIMERVINQPIRESTPKIDIIPTHVADDSGACLGLQQQQTKSTITKTVASAKNVTVNQSRAADAVYAFEAVLKDSNCYP